MKQQRKKIKNIFTEFDKRTGRKYETVSREWPDGIRFRRRCANLSLAKQLLGRINGAIVCGTWEALRNELRPERVQQPEQPTPAPVMVITYERLVREFKQFAIDTALSDWGKIQCYLADATIDFFGADTDITNITQRNIEEFMVWRRNEDEVRFCTINKDLSVLRSMFQKAIDWEYPTENPAAKVSNLPDDSTIHDRYLRPEEYERLLIAAYAQREVLRVEGDKLCFLELPEFIVFGVHNGPRLSETLSLPLASVDLERCQFSVKNRPNKRTKNGTERHIRFNQETREVIQTLKRKAVNAAGMLFQMPDGSGWQEQRRIIQNQFAECVRAAELHSDNAMENVTIHTLRHTFGSWLALKGVPIRKIQALMGHASINTTMRYMNLNPKETLDDTAVLDGITSGFTTAEKLATNWQRESAVENANYL